MGNQEMYLLKTPDELVLEKHVVRLALIDPVVVPEKFDLFVQSLSDDFCLETGLVA
jgi:hypothetical protein